MREKSRRSCHLCVIAALCVASNGSRTPSIADGAASILHPMFLFILLIVLKIRRSFKRTVLIMSSRLCTHFR